MTLRHNLRGQNREQGRQLHPRFSLHRKIRLSRPDHFQRLSKKPDCFSSSTKLLSKKAELGVVCSALASTKFICASCCAIHCIAPGGTNGSLAKFSLT